MNYLWVYIVIYMITGIFGYGITFASMQGMFPDLAEEGYRGDFTFAVFVGLLGPVGLIAMLFMSSFVKHGLKWK